MDKVIVLEGNITERKRALKKIKDSFTEGYDVTIFDNKDHYDYVSNSLTEISCFGEDKLFIMKELPKIEAPNEAQARTKVMGRLKKLFPSIPHGNMLVFNNVGISAESFFKEVRKYGHVHKFDQKIRKCDGVAKVHAFFYDRKIILDADVSQLLVDSLNLNGDDVDVDKLNLTITKFYHYIDGKNKVTKEDVYSVCSSSKDFIIWSLYKMLDDISSSKTKYLGSAISLVDNYLSNAKKFNVESILLIKGMVWRYGLLLLAKGCVNNNMSQKEISKKISNINKLESHGRSYKIKMNKKMSKDLPLPEYSSRMINSVMNSYYGKAPLSCYSYEQLLLIYYALVKVTIKVRTGCTESEIKIALTIVISVICGAITKKNTVDGILEHNKILYGIGT
jgi:DNA polymerase III delta subunit